MAWPPDHKAELPPDKVRAQVLSLGARVGDGVHAKGAKLAQEIASLELRSFAAACVVER